MTLRAPHTEVHAMRAQPLQDAFSPQGIKPHLTHPTHDLILLRHLIPWHPILDRLVPFYHAQQGRTGHSLRLLVAAALLSRLRPLSARKVIETMQENRSMQYFCPVPAHSLLPFLTPSTLCRFRQRIGQEGPLILEAQVLQPLKRASGIDAAMMRMDATVLESPIIYPTDVQRLCKACGKMAVGGSAPRQTTLAGRPPAPAGSPRLSQGVLPLVCARLREL
jgi:transposase, IS5 family